LQLLVLKWGFPGSANLMLSFTHDPDGCVLSC